MTTQGLNYQMKNKIKLTEYQGRPPLDARTESKTDLFHKFKRSVLSRRNKGGLNNFVLFGLSGSGTTKLIEEYNETQSEESFRIFESYNLRFIDSLDACLAYIINPSEWGYAKGMTCYTVTNKKMADDLSKYLPVYYLHQ